MISVAMAVYNGANYIEEQLDSILNQSRAVDEIVIVDDGSSDGSRDILLRFKQKYPIIRLFFNKNNLGYLKNFTKAASLTRGDIIFFCDQDDCWYQNKVETMIHTMEKHPEIGVLASSFEFMDGEGKTFRVEPRKGMSNNNMYLKPVPPHKLVEVTFEEFCLHNYFQGCSMAIKKEVLQLFVKSGTDYLPHDWQIALIASHEHSFYFLNEPLFRYRIHEKNTIGVPFGKRNEEWVRIKVAEDLRDSVFTIQNYWPEEFMNNSNCSDRIKFCDRHIAALKNRDIFDLATQNLNPVYRELKGFKARCMDLVFALTVPKGKTTSDPSRK